MTGILATTKDEDYSGTFHPLTLPEVLPPASGGQRPSQAVAGKGFGESD
ncbi:MAG: hypothetical protein ABIF11_00620 [Nitrospirota bacterium]